MDERVELEKTRVAIADQDRHIQELIMGENILRILNIH